MAIVKCHECGNEVSTETKTCPKCGAKVKKPMAIGAMAIVIAIGTAILYPLLDISKQAGSAGAASSVECSTGNIEIKSVRARWIDNCRTTSCAYLQGAGELVNNCRVATGIQLRVTGYDKTGSPIASHAAWPASIKNIPPGHYVFSLDHWLEYDPAIKRFDVTVESVKSW